MAAGQQTAHRAAKKQKRGVGPRQLRRHGLALETRAKIGGERSSESRNNWRGSERASKASQPRTCARTRKISESSVTSSKVPEREVLAQAKTATRVSPGGDQS